jgi:hypothetical protein
MTAIPAQQDKRKAVLKPIIGVSRTVAKMIKQQSANTATGTVTAMSPSFILTSPLVI